MIKVTRAAYQKLIDGDLDWLMKQPKTLERDHIAAIVRESVETNYGENR